MGCAASSATKPEEGDDADKGFAEAAALKIDELLQSRRVNMSTYINGAPPKDSDERMLRAIGAATVFAATEEHFTFFVDAPDSAIRLNDLGLQLSPASMNFAVTGLSLIIELSRQITDAGIGVHNEPISPEQRERAFQLRAMWAKMIKANSIRNIRHPRLGTVPVVQPLLHTLIYWRGTGMGNGNGSSPDPIFELFVEKGARLDIVNSLGLSVMHQVVGACARACDADDGGAGAEEDEPAPEADRRVQQSLSLARLLIGRGASVLQPSRPFARAKQVAHAHALEVYDLVAEGRAMNAVEACDWLNAAKPRRSLRLLAPILGSAAVAEGERRAPERELAVLGPDSAGFKDRSTHPLAPTGLPASSWVQAVFNMSWVLSQLTALDSAAERRALLTRLALVAPFELPLMVVMPWLTLKQLERIPRRDTSGKRPEEGWAGPVPVSCLPEGARVLFLSHRWLRPGHPDDEDRRGTKFRQISSVVEQLCKAGQKEDELYLWIDYCCLDQSNPFPGVQMLPAIMACSEEVAYVAHPEYFKRAWCRTELFFHWRLHCHTRKWRLTANSGQLAEEPRTRPRGDPATGDLFHEADRVALTNMTALFSYDDAD